MGLVTLFRGPRFLVFLYSKLRALPFLPGSLNFLFQLLERVLGGDRGPRLLEVIFHCHFLSPRFRVPGSDFKDQGVFKEGS